MDPIARQHQRKGPQKVDVDKNAQKRPSKRRIQRGNSAGQPRPKPGVNSLLFDGEADSGGEAEPVTDERKRSPDDLPSRAASAPLFGAEMPTRPLSSAAFANTGVFTSIPEDELLDELPQPAIAPAVASRDELSKGVPRALSISVEIDSTPDSKLQQPQATYDGALADAVRLGTDADEGFEKKDEPEWSKALMESLHVLQTNYKSLTEWSTLQHQLTHRLLEQQEELKVVNALDSMKDWCCSQELLTRKILERQEQLQDALQTGLADVVHRSVKSALSEGDSRPVAAPVFLGGRSAEQPFPSLPEQNNKVRRSLANMTRQSSTGIICSASVQEGQNVYSSASQQNRVKAVCLGVEPDEDFEAKSNHGDSSACLASSGTALHAQMSAARSQSRRSATSIHLVKTLTVAGYKHKNHAGGCLAKIVEHKSFEYICALVILSHSLFIASYVEYLATVNADGHIAFYIGNLFLTFCFLMEVVLKLLVERREYLFGIDRSWNLFDLSLLALVAVEMGLGIVLAGKDKKKMKTVLKMMEMARTVRILRIFRFLKFSKTLQVIIIKIFMSMKTLSWVLLLICTMQVIVAVCFTQGANEFLGGAPRDIVSMTAEQRQVHKHFGSVGKSVKTCFASISGGIMWGEVSEELGYINFIYAIFFGFYIAAVTFAGLNIVTGIFINDMFHAERQYEDESKAQKLADSHEELGRLFHSADTSADGEVSLEEFMGIAGEPVIVEILQQLGIDTKNAGELFKLLDEDDSGDLGVDEFLAGCLQLMAGSTGMDMKLLSHEIQRLRRKLSDVILGLERVGVPMHAEIAPGASSMAQSLLLSLDSDRVPSLKAAKVRRTLERYRMSASHRTSKSIFTADHRL